MAYGTTEYIKEDRFGEFVEWVCSLRAHNNPRGDFIKDTRGLRKDALAAGEDPAKLVSRALSMACAEADAEYSRLQKEWLRMNPDARRVAREEF